VNWDGSLTFKAIYWGLCVSLCSLGGQDNKNDHWKTGKNTQEENGPKNTSFSSKNTPKKYCFSKFSETSFKFFSQPLKIQNF
jgi:hypothetical protein